MKKSNVWLVTATIIPLAVLFWPMPYKPWNSFVDGLLCAIPSFAAQILFCRVGKRSVVRVIPAIFTGAFAGWGVYLSCVSPDWQASLIDLFRAYVSPFLCCLLVLLIFLLGEKNDCGGGLGAFCKRRRRKLPADIDNGMCGN